MYEINARIERPDPALIEQVKDLYYCMVGVCVGPRYVMSPMGLDLSVFKQMGQMFGLAKGVFCASFSCYAACR